MAITAESLSNKILVTITDDFTSDNSYYLQREDYKNRTWETLTETGFAILTDYADAKKVTESNIIDSFSLTDGLYSYRYIKSDLGLDADGENFTYSKWVKYGSPEAIGYTFGNYKPSENDWGVVLTPDDMRFTYLWGTDFKATNGTYFTDEQIKFFIEEATSYLERMLNIDIVKKVIKCQASDRGFTETDYDIEEPYYDFTLRKIQRYGMIQTKHRPIINVEKCALLNRDNSTLDLLDSAAIDRKQGVIKFTKRTFMPSDTARGIDQAIGRYGQDTIRTHLFYLIDYSAGYKTSDAIPKDLRQIIGKVAAISLLNIIGDGLMAGFSSSSLSMDGISESFSSTQSATSATFGARIAVYQKEVENYIKENKYRFGFLPIGAL